MFIYFVNTSVLTTQLVSIVNFMNSYVNIYQPNSLINFHIKYEEKKQITSKKKKLMMWRFYSHTSNALMDV